MSSGWASSAKTVLVKEARTELRSRHGLFVGGLFLVVAVFAAAYSIMDQKIEPGIAAGFLAVILAFVSATILPRLFLVEDEAGTLDLLRLLAEPTAAYAGKMFYAVLQMIVAGLLTGGLAVFFMHLKPVNPALFVTGLLACSIALGTSMSLAGALAIGAANRWLLAAAAGLPLVLPELLLMASVLKRSMGEGYELAGWLGVGVLMGFAICSAVLGIVMAGPLWRLEPGPKDSAKGGSE